MKKITWLHISDWHQKGEEFGKEVVGEKLIEDIKKRSEISSDLDKVDFIIFSGDLAYSGKNQEYELAQQRLLDPLLDATGLKPDKLFFVPGNHDCDRSRIEAFESFESSKDFKNNEDVNKLLESEEQRNKLLKSFQSYKEFIKKYNDQNHPEYASTRILTINGE